MKTKKRRVWDTNSFAEELYKRSEGRYILKGEYVKYNERIDTLCTRCDNVFGLLPKGFITKDNGCPYCAGNAGRNSKWLAEKTFEVVGDEFTFLDEYKGAVKKHRIRHNPCGVVYEIAPSAFFSRPFHPACPEDFRVKVREMVGDEYSVLDDYSHSRVSLKFRHNTCGRVYSETPAYFLSGRRCEYCFTGCHFSTEDIKDRVHRLTGGEYSFSDTYSGMTKESSFTHTLCGTVFKSKVSSFIHSHKRCPKCFSSLSHGEKEVADVLDSLPIEYTREHSFEYLGRKRFDFFIPSLNIAIEYDGRQHFEAVDHWGGEDTLKRTQESDALKNDFCEYTGIDLLRIPYWEFGNIHEIVTNFIDTVKLMRSISASGSEMSKCR